MKVSVIICFYNVDKFLQEAIESVLSQVYENWELLLIDDGSTDNSTRIAKEYVATHPTKIVYFDHEGHINKGLSASRNFGVTKLTGDLVTFLDGDDIWKPNYLSNQLGVLQKQNVTIVCEATEYWYNWNNSLKQNVTVLVGAEQNMLYEPPQLMLQLYPLGSGASPCMCAIILPKNILVKYPFDDSFRGMYEDQVLLSKLFLNEPIYISSHCNNLYRQRSDSLVGTSHQKGNYIKIRRYFLKWLQHYMNQGKFNYDKIDKLLQKALQLNRLDSIQLLKQRIQNKTKALLKLWIPLKLKKYIKSKLI